MSKAQSLQVPRNPGSTEDRKLRSTSCSPNTRGFFAKKARLRTTGDRAVPTPWPERTNVRPSEVKDLLIRDGLVTDFCGKHLRARQTCLLAAFKDWGMLGRRGGSESAEPFMLLLRRFLANLLQEAGKPHKVVAAASAYEVVNPLQKLRKS